MSSNDFTEREMQIMALAWRCFEDQPKVNFPKLAELAGMTNHVSACNAWAKIKKKLAAQAEGVTGGFGSSSPTKVKATPKKRGAKKAADEDDDGEEKPAKKQRATGKKTKKSATPEEDGDELAAGVKDESDDLKDSFV